MTEQPTSKETPDNAGELRHKLIKRLAVAGALVAVLFGVLAFFDYLSTPPEEPDEEVYTRPVPVPPKKPVSQPVTPTTELPEPPAPTAVQTPPPPQIAAQPPAVPAPSESKTAARPEARSPAPVLAPAAPLPVPPVAKPPAAVPVPPVTTAPAVAPRAARVAPEVSAPPVVAAPAEPAPPAKASARVAESRGVPVAEPSGIARLFSGFLLQAGVFTSQQRAEELHARLTLSGVPSTLETRVQVGPFRTRQEAEAAQVKLRELGIDTVLVPPRKH